jgi:tetratricopeptide (TPR) repeat protein
MSRARDRSARALLARRGATVGALAACALALAGCGGKRPDPAPTVGVARVVRGAMTVSRAGQDDAVHAPTRVETGAKVTTGDDGRGALTMDTGAWVLFDRGTEATVALDALTLGKGRVWIDARGADDTRIETPRGSLVGTGATFAIALAGDVVEVYCASGEVTYRTPGGEGRLAQGETAKLRASGAPEVGGEALWDDWTGGLADPTPRPRAEASAVGVLAGRTIYEKGVARTPLAIRGQEVRVSLNGDVATTDVLQSFFNARSDTLEAEYKLRLPRTAVVESFEVDTGSGFETGQVSALGTESGYQPMWMGADFSHSALAYDGPGTYRARIYPVTPGATVRVRVRYVEWLERRGDVRTYTYPMASEGEPPLVGEFVLDLDARGAGPSKLRAGMGARVEQGRVVLRRSDFRPRADFHLDLIDAHPAPRDVATAYVVQADRDSATQGGAAEGSDRYVLIDVPTAGDRPPPTAPLSLVVVVDTSGGTEPESLELSRAVVESVLRQLAPGDEVALRVADVGARVPEGAPEGLVPPTPENAEALLGALARAELGGATDLARSLRDAAAIVAGKPRATVLYLGDGIPTTGAVDATSVRTQLAAIESPPRFFALGVGDGANADLLRALFGAESRVVRERVEAARAVMAMLADAARPVLRGVTVDLGPTLERVYPRPPLVMDDGANLRLVGRLRGELPKAITLRATRGAEVVERRLTLRQGTAVDRGDVRRRWATARLSELLDEDAGREALVDLGTRFGIVTPWTSLVIGYPRGNVLPFVRGFDRDPTEIAWDRGGGASTVTLADLGGDLGWRRRAPAREVEPAASPEATWVPRVTDGLAAAGTTTGDGGLSQAAVRRALEIGGRGPQGCYERKLIVRPDLSGTLALSIEVDGSGRATKVQTTSDSLGDPDVRACVETEVRGLRFPATGGGVVRVTHAFVFAMPTRPIGTRVRCSDASEQGLTVREQLWRERLLANSGVTGALSVWRDALSQCELKTWRDRRVLLDRLLAHVGGVRQQVELYGGLRADGAVAAYLRRAILRNVRTPWDVDAVRQGLDLEAQVDWAYFARQFRSIPSPEARLALVRKWLEVLPDEMDLRLRLLALLEETGKLPEARRVARELRADPLADARVRTAVGEFWLRQRDEGEARRVFSEIVELAPLDPWARQRLGDLYRAHGWADDAYREYAMLARLRPNDGAVMLLLARAAADAGRLDEALRLEQRLGESVEHDVDTGAAGLARLWTLVRLALLRESTRDPATLERVRERERAAGALRDPPDLLVALTWAHPDDRPELYLRHPGVGEDATATGELRWERATTRGPDFGLEATRVRDREDGEYVFEVRRTERDALRDTVAELTVLVAPGTPEQRLLRAEVRLDRTTRTRRFALRPDGTLAEVPVPTPTATPRPAGGAPSG